ncbi:single-stranded DNA-binding protein [Chitinispirillales bacterium ANBcel5]|uniref:single-stranded DNA-binding protein n=1 Tax=Cellulosispirillum alkaliphilum TaxID=3039283 RepID=UPI002A5089F2|nr:single-stranded DNA-binding protein [Chitinispirillales bacterium ANBcel5]
MGVNKAILIGNLGRDPELKYTPSGQPVASFPLATSERWTDKSGQRQDRTEWHNIVVWGRQAEFVNQYLKKGRSCYIEGKISTRSWDDRDGNKKYRTEIVALSVEFLNSPSGSSGSAQSGSNQSQNFQNSSPSPQYEPQVNEQFSADEDLPF